VLKLRSTTQVTLVAFSLVVIPLFVALIYSAQQLRKIDLRLHQTTQENIIIAAEYRDIYNLLDSIERSARQFSAINDVSFLNTARLFNNAANIKLNKLASMPLGTDILSITNNLKIKTNAVDSILSKEVNNDKTELKEIFSNIRSLNFDLNKSIQARAEATAEDLNNESSKIKNTLLSISFFLIPATLISIAYFSRLINRPIAQIRVAIEKLGKQHLDNKIVVSGPQNLELLGSRLEWLRLQLKDIEAQKQQFLSHVSHELKTPLTAIREGTALLSEEAIGSLNTKQIEINEILKKNSLQLQNQIENLLTYNKAIINSDLSKRLEMPLDDIIKEVIDEQKLSIKTRKITLKTSFKSVICRVDPEQMLVVFRNLLSNAVKYTPPGGVIKLSLKEKTSYSEFNLEDTGPGIHEDERDQVFRAFFKGKQDGMGYMKGTGLGLAIVAQFIHFHKGEINLIESPVGAHFRIRLPKS